MDAINGLPEFWQIFAWVSVALLGAATCTLIALGFVRRWF